MILSRRVKLGATYMDELDSSIVIRSIEIGTPSESVSTASLAGGAGQRILSRHWDTMDVTVNFAIDLPKKSLASRRSVWESVAAWAMGGEGNWLRVNYIADKRLMVDRAEISVPGDFYNWTDEYTVTFHAISVPFWQDETPTEITKTSIQTTSFDISVPGQVRTVADLEIKNVGSSALTAYTIITPAASFMLSGFSVPVNDTITVSHYNGRVRIYNGDTNLLHYRTGLSGDDIYLDPGTNTIQQVLPLNAGPVNLKMTVAGRYV